MFFLNKPSNPEELGRLLELQKNPNYKKYVREHQRKLRRLKREENEDFLNSPPNEEDYE